MAALRYTRARVIGNNCTGSGHLHWLRTVLSCVFIGVSSLVASCALDESASEATPECAAGEDLADAVFRFQFANNRSSTGSRAARYFLALEDEADPSEDLLRRFSGHSPPVSPLSDLTMSDSAERVIDPDTGKPALIFRIYKRSMLSNAEAVVEGGYYEANLSASWITMKAECRDGTWHVEKIGPEKIASQLD
jgi:hypothetical protein